MTTAKKIGLITLIASLSWGAQAANFDYNYGQIGYELGDYQGLTLTGSYEINKDIFVVASYIATSNDDLVFDLDYDEIRIGAGYRMPINGKTDAVFTVSFDSGEVDKVVFGTPVSVDDTGLYLTAGVRHNLNSKVELAGSIYHITTFDGDTGIRGEVRYNINDKMSAGLAYLSGDYLDGLSLNFRMNF